eukprot:11171429-Lingulodinium_polyedra.AAC.1
MHGGAAPGPGMRSAAATPARARRKSVQASRGSDRSVAGVHGLSPAPQPAVVRPTSAAWPERPGCHFRWTCHRDALSTE